MARFVLTAQLQLQAPNNVAQVVSQIQNQLNNISVNIQVQGSARAQQQIQQITASTNQATSAAERMGRAFAVSIRRFAAFSIATRAVGLFTSTLSDAIQTAIDFERQLIKVAQVTGKGVGDLRDLTNEITNLAKGLGVSSQSLLEVTTILTQAGLSATDTKIALNSLAQAALAPNFDSITQTAEGAIAILAQFQEGVEALEGQLGSINAVAGAFAVEASDLIDVIRRTGGVFKSSGGDLNELLALFTSVRATTRESAESIGTGLRTIFTRIQRPETIEFLKQFGVNLLDLEGKFVGPYEAIKRLSEALSGLGERDITFIKIAEELGGFRQIGKVLPLLQQFATAEAALNVAQNANNSLSKDAASAQAALAIRIMKVKEEFLALIRSITETPTFQIMANTALTLASALIKVAESIKPLLPLLAAVAAFRAIRGVGTFVGSTVAGLQSGRTFNKGGKVHHFATGGLVPGVGNSDTVPAMLSPGEFVIRKSSVQSIGASNLSGMNQGGIVQKFAGGGRIFGAVGLTPMNDIEDEKGRVIIGTGSPKESSISSVLARKAGGGGSTGVFSRVKQKDWQQAIRSAIGGPSIATEVMGRTFKLSDLENTLGSQVDSAISSLVTSTAQVLGAKTGVAIEGSVTPNILSSIGTRSTIGSIFEGALSLLGAPFDKSISSEQDPFDFPSGLGGGLSQYFGFAKGIPVEAKKDLNPGLMADIANRKATNLIAEEVYRSPQWQALLRPVKKAAGGGVGTDTVPAMLTPGEFVVNRSSAQRIGYGNLNHMNKVGKYANGGIVQHFAGGTSAAGVKAPAMLTGPSGFASFDALNKQAILLAKAQQVHINATNAATQGQNQNTQSNTQNTQSQNQNTQAQNRNSKSALESAASNKMFAASMAVGLLQGFLPAVDENSSMLLKFSTSLLGIVSTVTTLGFALEAFGVNLTLAELTNLDKMANRLGLVFDNIGKIGSSLVSSIKNVIISKTSEAAASKASAAADSAEAAASATSTVADTAEAAASATSTAADTAEAAASTAAAAADTAEAAASTAAAAADTVEAAASTAAAGADAAQAVGGITKQASALGQKLGGFAIGATAAYLATKVFSDALRKSAEDMNKAKIDAGDVEGARQAGENLPGLDYAELLGNIGLAAGVTIGGGVGAFGGAAAGSVVPVVGNLVGTAAGAAGGAAIGGVTGYGLGRAAGNFINSTVGRTDNVIAAGSASASAAQFVKTNKILENSSEKAAKALQDIESGAISFKEGLNILSIETQSSVDAMRLANEANAAQEKVNSKKSTGFGRTFGAYISGGYVDSNEEVQQQNNTIKQRRQESQRIGQQQLKTLQPLLQGQMRTTAITGGDFDSFLDSLSDTEFELLNMTDDGIKNAYQAFTNITKEIEITRQALDAMNLGLRGPTATATAMSSSMDRFAAGLEVGGSSFVSNAQFLSEAMTSAAQAMNDEDIKSSMQDVRKNLEEMGVSPEFADKFETNANAFIQAQKNYGTAFDSIVANLKAQREKGLSPNTSPMAIKEAFAKELTAGLGDEAKQNLTNIIKNIDLNDAEVEKILAGDLSVFGDKLTEAGQKQIEDIVKIAQERQKAENVLIDLTKKRIDAERNSLEAQKEALSLTMEGRELQSKYGGKVVTNEERKQSVLARANVNSKESGLTGMKTGSLEELRARNSEIKKGFSDIEAQRRQPNGLQKASGVVQDEKQKDLQKAQKEQIATIRELVKLEEENLKLIGEKNKLEKDSIDALVSGDIDKFMQTQATIGATAAIATGNQSLMKAFGGEALGAAAQDIRRQQEAGVGQLYGRDLAGQGGLTQQAYGAALGARGVTDPRLAQVAAGTTAEEEAAKSRLRDYGTALGETGQLGAEMASMQFETAEINVKDATVVMDNIIRQGNAVAAGRANGGLIYANRGMFIPRGSDTVPAMLTPGEFVVRREAVNRGNNLQLLQSINGGGATANSTVMGFARGGQVQYYSGGGGVSNNGSSESFEKLTKALSKVMGYVNGVAESIKSLPTTISHQIADTKVDVNVMGGNMLNAFADNLESRVMNKVSEKLKNSHPTEAGMQSKGSVLG